LEILCELSDTHDRSVKVSLKSQLIQIKSPEWDHILANLKPMINVGDYEQFILPLVPIHYNDGVVTLVVPNNRFKKIIEESFSVQIDEASEGIAKVLFIATED